VASQYRSLDETRIVATLTRLQDRIAERFPDSGLARVAGELLTLSQETTDFVAYVRRPHWPIRVGAGLAIAAMAVVLLAMVGSLRVSTAFDGLPEFVQALDATTSSLVFLGAVVFFLITLENRLKRRKALVTLHQLRSVAHVVDMHQLTKDPERLGSPEPSTPSSPVRSMSAPALGRYLDYCSELLSLVSKIAALHVQHFDDAVALATVNEIETLTTGLSGKIWQKITLLERS